MYYKKGNEDEQVSYNNSIADLMAGMLIIFILLFVFVTVTSNSELRKKEKVIEGFTMVKTKIIDQVIETFKINKISIDIDTSTGSIKIDEKLLFSTNESKLKPEGKEYLKKFIPIYVKLIILDDNIKKEISQVIIEGHTDDVGSYIFNMELSQRRAFEVLKYIYTEMDEFEGKEEFEKYVTANGKSKIDLIKDKYGNIDRDKSRRVEIKFKLKEEETIKKIRETLEG
ncbi:MAG: OmpA family protein [Cetobacterium sp.]|uniref:OmpA family protein n=1 Tax=Cetobacterium sp. TaxID=2071632 RepID=UPI003EE4A76A